MYARALSGLFLILGQSSDRCIGLAAKLDVSSMSDGETPEAFRSNVNPWDPRRTLRRDSFALRTFGMSLSQVDKAVVDIHKSIAIFSSREELRARSLQCWTRYRSFP
jgi:hypothetical protein